MNSTALTFFIDLSKFASGPGKGLVTAKEPRSSIIVFYMEKEICEKDMFKNDFLFR